MVKIYFDLDGTVFNLYGRKNWLEMLRNEQPGAYTDAGLENGGFLPEINIAEFYEICQDLIMDFGVEFGVITWLSMTATEEFEEITTKEKLQWCRKYLPFVKDFNAQSYGVPKQKAIKKKCKTMFLIDDNLEVCKTWETPKTRMYENVTKDWNVVSALVNIYRKLAEEDF